MGKTSLADTLGEITKLQRTPPPMVGMPQLGDAQFSRPWPNIPFDAYLPAMTDHIIAGVFEGDGESVARIGGSRLSALSERGGVVVLPAGHDGHWTMPTVSNVYLDPRRVQRCADEVGSGRRVELLDRLHFDDPKLFNLLDLLAAEAMSEDSISKLYVEQLVDLLCLQLLRDHSDFASTTTAPGGLGKWQVRRITHYMEEHLEEQIGLQELANLLGLSRFHLCTAFRKATGFTPHQWLVRLRMAQARQLLTDFDNSITEVSLAVGYQTPSSFSSAFRESIGVTPSAFRKSI